MKKLDIESLRRNKKFVIVSSDEALKDVVPINWSQEVLDGTKKIVISGGKRQ